MPGTLFNFPFDEELFLMQWQNAPDPVLTALLNCGAMQNNETIRTLISTGSDLYSIPFYDLIGGTPDNYDGVADITMSEPTGFSQTGVVYGRSHSWKDKDFIHDFNSGADPTKQIASQVAMYWQHRRQEILLAIINGIFAQADDSSDFWDSWQLHTLDIATDTTSVADANKLADATAADAVQQAVGDFGNIFTMAVMHSKVATNLAKLQLLAYRKYTDIFGIQRTIGLADYNGMTVIVDDSVPVANSATASGAKDYTTYLFGVGAFQYAPAPVKVPIETGRERLLGGGYDYLVTRLRETIHPNGFSFTPPASNYTKSPTNAQLGYGATTTSNWSIIANPKAVPVARIISNG